MFGDTTLTGCILFFIYVEVWDTTGYCAEAHLLTFSFKNIKMERFRK
jgi:hypothetical protein